MATHEAESTSLSHVQAAVDLCDAGDIVTVPSGSSTWNSGLTITTHITLQGAGIGNTVITNGQNDDGGSAISIVPAAPATTDLIRVTGFTFDGNNESRGISISNGTTTLFEQIRIDHNRFFECTTRALAWSGFVHGLVDNNEAVDCQIFCGVYGDYWNSWDLIPIDLGSAHYLIVEDNAISTTGNRYVTFVMHCGQGGRYTFRHNTVNWLDGGNYFEICDAHGNQEPVTAPYNVENNPPHGGHRGTVCTEIYENTISGPNTRASRFFYHRGGIGLVFNNTITGTGGVDWNMTEEDGWRFGFLSEWPGYDPVEETYIYNNTLNAATFEPTLRYYEDDIVFIQEDRDYFLTNPVGETINGGVYAPYTYPHPLCGGDPGPSGEGPFASDLLMVVSQLFMIPIIQYLLGLLRTLGGLAWFHAATKVINKYL